MQWSGKAILLSAKRFGEHGAIVRLLSPEHGLYAGVARHAMTSKQRGIFAVGNIVEAHWSARLPEQMGSFKAELVTPVAALAMQDTLTLAALQSATQLVDATLPERDRSDHVYHTLEDFLLRLITGHDWQMAYALLEMALLRQLGFGLELNYCAATGMRDELCYVSPKSGHAVSREAGLPYRERMLPLPAFLSEKAGDTPVSAQDVLDALTLTAYFLEHRAFAAQDKQMPRARQHFVALLAARTPSDSD